GEVIRRILSLGGKERSMIAALDEQAIAGSSGHRAGDVNHGDWLETSAVPVERFVGRNGVDIEKRLKGCLRLGDHPHTTPKAMLPERPRQRRFDIQPRKGATRIELPLKSDRLQPAGMIRVQMADVYVGDVEVGQT